MDTNSEQGPITRDNQENQLAASGYLFMAMWEISISLGGKELADRVISKTVAGSHLPSSDAFDILEGICPGTIDRVLIRAYEIEQRELDAIQNPEREQDPEKLRGQSEADGALLLIAIQEVAQELVGKELAHTIVESAVSDTGLPNFDALADLEKIHKGAIDIVMIRILEMKKHGIGEHERF